MTNKKRFAILEIFIVTISVISFVFLFSSGFFSNITGDLVWNLSNYSYDSVSISTQDSSPSGLFFKPDGTKLYEVGYGDDLFYQYTCSDAWNLNSCSYDNINLSTEGSSPSGLFFKPDGTKLYESGIKSDFGAPDGIAYQHSCSDAWNLSSCVYDEVSLSSSNFPFTDLSFKSDGMNYYVLEEGATDDNVYVTGYSCSDQWNLSSCGSDGTRFHLADGNGIGIPDVDSGSEGFFFKSDGTRLYTIGTEHGKIYQHSCSDAWNLSSCSYDNVNISTQDSVPRGLFIKPDGLVLYEIGSDGDKIYQYDLPYPSADLVSPSNNTTFVTGSVNFSVSLSDVAQVGITNVTINVYNSTGLTYSSVNTSGLTGTYTWTANLSEGNYNWTVSLFDSTDNLSHEADNGTLFFSVDTTAPTVAFSCSPSTVEPQEAVTCSCSGSDATSGVASTSFTEKPSTVNTGTFTKTCTVTDNAGNSNSESASFKVESANSISSSETIFDSSQPISQKSHLITKISSDKEAVLSNIDGDSGVREIKIRVNKDSENVKVNVASYNDKPAEVLKERTGRNYRYLKIDVENVNSNLEKGIVTFQIEKDWIKNSSLTRDDIGAYKFNENLELWEEQNTSFRGEEEDFYFYDVEVKSFSFFSIGEKEKNSNIIEETAEAVRESYDEASETLFGAIVWWIVFFIIIDSVMIVIVLFFFMLKKRDLVTKKK